MQALNVQGTLTWQRGQMPSFFHFTPGFFFILTPTHFNPTLFILTPRLLFQPTLFILPPLFLKAPLSLKIPDPHPFNNSSHIRSSTLVHYDFVHLSKKKTPVGELHYYLNFELSLPRFIFSE